MFKAFKNSQQRKMPIAKKKRKFHFRIMNNPIRVVIMGRGNSVAKPVKTKILRQQTNAASYESVSFRRI